MHLLDEGSFESIFCCPIPPILKWWDHSSSPPASSFQVCHCRHHFPTPQPTSAEATSRQPSDQSSRNTVVFHISPLPINLQWLPMVNGIKLNLSGGHSQVLYCPVMRASPWRSCFWMTLLFCGEGTSTLYSNIHLAWFLSFLTRFSHTLTPVDG